LFNIDGLGQHQIGPDAECLGDSGLSFDHGDRQRSLIGRRVARALEEQRGVLLVVAVDDDGVEVRAHQLLHRGKGLGAGVDFEVQFGENLRDRARSFLVGTEKKGLVAHTKVIVGTGVRGQQVTLVIRGRAKLLAGS